MKSITVTKPEKLLSKVDAGELIMNKPNEGKGKGSRPLKLIDYYLGFLPHLVKGPADSPAIAGSS